MNRIGVNTSLDFGVIWQIWGLGGSIIVNFTKDAVSPRWISFRVQLGPMHANLHIEGEEYHGETDGE